MWPSVDDEVYKVKMVLFVHVFMKPKSSPFSLEMVDLPLYSYS